jgi:hypothetical protein
MQATNKKDSAENGFVGKILTKVKRNVLTTKEEFSFNSENSPDIENDSEDESEDESLPYCDPPEGYVRLRPSKVII